MWKIVYTKRANKDKKKLKAAGLDEKAKSLVEIVRDGPFSKPRNLNRSRETFPAPIPEGSIISTGSSTKWSRNPSRTRMEPTKER